MLKGRGGGKEWWGERVVESVCVMERESGGEWGGERMMEGGRGREGEEREGGRRGEREGGGSGGQ